MANRARITVEWLRRGRPIEDVKILRNLIVDVAGSETELKVLDEKSFESAFDLEGLPRNTIPQDILQQKLAYRDTEAFTGWQYPLEPKGESLREQVKSLIPPQLDSDFKTSISYALSHVVLDDLRRNIEWGVLPEGLDDLSAAILTINLVSQIARDEVDWLRGLWSIAIQREKEEGLKRISAALGSDRRIDDLLDIMEETRDQLKKHAHGDPIWGKLDNWILGLKQLLKEGVKTLGERPEVGKHSSQTTLRARINEELSTFGKSSTYWHSLSLRPDGVRSYQMEPTLNRLRANINVLRSDLMLKLCEYLADWKSHKRVTIKDTKEALGISGSTAHQRILRLYYAMSERYTPTLNRFGLTYRYILTPLERSTIRSPGLISRLLMGSESSYRGATVHLEPLDSKGPDPSNLPSDSLQVTVDSEIVSMRLSLFDRTTGSWIIDLDTEGEPSKTSLWLRRGFDRYVGSLVIPTQRVLDLMGLLWVHRGNWVSRQWLLEAIKFPKRTAEYVLKQILDGKLMSILYRPSLQYCGLPEGVLTVACGMNEAEITEFTSWITRTLPFAKIFTDRFHTNMVAEIRVPAYKSDVVAGRIKEKLEETDSMFNVASIQLKRTFYMTALHRLMDHKSRVWIDPWLK
ncbi:MAG: hypothetical protein ACXAB9_07920 [Candidatus Thorarchaeota archaeon]|jgi:hypothetical protein